MIDVCIPLPHAVNRPQHVTLHHKFLPYKFSGNGTEKPLPEHQEKTDGILQQGVCRQEQDEPGREETGAL
jgi:hypothetical protein